MYWSNSQVDRATNRLRPCPFETYPAYPVPFTMTSVAFPKSIFSELAANLPRHACRTGESITMSSNRNCLSAGITSSNGKMSLILLLLLLAASCFSSASNTYYISKSTGSDSNAGIAKGTAWAHLPGMASWTGSHTPAAGDTFILMGCDTWVNTDLPVLWNWSGSSGNPITITVDKTWYNTTACPSGWNRPIWNAGGAAIMSPLNYMFVNGYSGATSWGVLDNIEMTGLYCGSSCSGAGYQACYEGCSNWVHSNLYAHGLHVVLDTNCSLFNGAGSSVSGNLWTDLTISGADAIGQNPAGGVCYAISGIMGGDIKSNVIHDLANGFVGSALAGGAPMTISGNSIYNIIESNNGSHPNAIEITGPNSTSTYYIHDNVIGPNLAPGAESMMLGNPGETDYVWNNVINISSGGAAPTFPQAYGNPGTAAYYWNNTITPPSGTNCFYQNVSPTPTVVIQNNHCITTGSLTNTFTSNSLTVTNNLLQTPSQADANVSLHFDQYTSIETYVYSPVVSTNSTVGYATNLASNCSGDLASLCGDTTYGTQRTSNPRPSTGAWDAGAYYLGSGSGGQPNPPTGLTAVVQ
jgi:hypothetical protein